MKVDRNILKRIKPFYILFALTICMIILVIIINYNADYNFDLEYIKTLPWNKRSTYIKQKEYLSKLKNKENYTDEDLILFNQLISISKVLEDTDTMKYVQKLKYEYLLSSIKNIINSENFENLIVSDVFKTKLGLYLLYGEDKLLVGLIKNSTSKERLQILYLLKIFYPDKVKNYEKFYTKEEIKNIDLIIEYINLKGE